VGLRGARRPSNRSRARYPQARTHADSAAGSPLPMEAGRYACPVNRSVATTGLIAMPQSVHAHGLQVKSARGNRQIHRLSVAVAFPMLTAGTSRSSLMGYVSGPARSRRLIEADGQTGLILSAARSQSNLTEGSLSPHDESLSPSKPPSSTPFVAVRHDGGVWHRGPDRTHVGRNESGCRLSYKNVEGQ
jgi:hypothetical protein